MNDSERSTDSVISSMGCQGIWEECPHCYIAPLNQIFLDVADTYSLLFRSRTDSYQDNLAVYRRLPMPSWVRIYAQSTFSLFPTQIGDTLYDVTHGLGKRTLMSDIEYHIAELHHKLPPTQQFEKYGIFENRLRELKAYMDSQKPGGIRALWRDKRDTLQWYTFWAVIIVGSLGIFLSFLGLIVTTVQTIGTFKGLEKHQ